MTASYVRLARLRDVSNSVQALRGVPAERVMEQVAPVLFAGALRNQGETSPFQVLGCLTLCKARSK